MWKTRAQILPALFLLANSISWFSLTWVVLGEAVSAASFHDILLVSSSYFGALIVSAFIGGTLLYKKLRGKTALLSWILAGGLICLFSALATEQNLFTLTVMSMTIASSVGVGIPNCLSLFVNSTKVENRGRLSAISFFMIQLLTGIFVLSMSDIGLGSKFLLLAGWRLVGLISLPFYKPLATTSEDHNTHLLSIIRERTFVLYFLPWFLFTLVNFIEAPILEKFFGPNPEMVSNYLLATTLIASVSALLGGALCDFKGRKVTGIVGFVLLGLGYAILSFFSSGVEKAFSQILYVVFDGAAWGILYVTFIFVVWGDVAEGKIREKYFLLGGLPFLFSGLIEVLVQPFVAIVPVATSFSLASFFLFLAILPLLYAPETLSETMLKNREMKKYIEKAQKEVAKAHKKAESSEKEADEQVKECGESEVKFEVPQEDFEKAEELAEKYY